MKLLTFFLLFFSLTVVSAQEVQVEAITSESKIIVMPTIDIESTDLDSTVVFNKKKATFYIKDFGLEKISKAKHAEFFYKKSKKNNKLC